MTSSARVALAAGTVAATLAGVVPMVSHGPATTNRAAVTATTGTTLVVPKAATVLVGQANGSQALARAVHLTVVRSSDGATLFTGTLATFHTLPVVAGAKLVLKVQRPSGFTGATAGASLRFA